MRKLLTYFIILLFFIANNSCRRDDLSSDNNNQNSVTKVNAKIILPSGVTLTNAENYTIASADGSFKINPNYTTGKSSGNSTIYACTPEVKTTGGNQIIFLINQVGTAVAYGYNALPTADELSTYNGIYISAETTAIASLLSYPMIASPYKDVQDAMAKDIVTMPSYSAYLDEVIAKITEVAKIPACVSVDYTALPHYRQVLVEYFNTYVVQNTLPQSNLEYNQISETNGTFKFTIKNKGMRTVDIYANKVYLTSAGVPYQSTPINIAESGESESSFINLPAKLINYSDFVLGSLNAYLFSNTMPDYLTMNETKELTANVGDAQRLGLEVWGIGQPHKPIAEFTNDDVKKLTHVVVEAGVNEFLTSMLSINEGINQKVISVQNTDVFDFRYGIRKAPFVSLVTKLTDAYITKNSSKLLQYINEKDYKGMISDMGVFVSKELFTDFDTNGGAKYLNDFYNIYKNIAGTTKTSDQFRAAFKLGYASLWHWFELADKTIKLSTAAVNLSAAINDAYSSSMMVSFTKNISTIPDNNSITIGSQIWQAKNLDVNTYSDGTPIPEITDPTAWANATTGAWCYYNNDPVNGAVYGKLYNWYAVAGIYDSASANNPSLRKKLAPSGWHVPTNSEWTLLTDYLGGELIAGEKLKEIGTTHWFSPNVATNSSGFLALPSGGRDAQFGNFDRLGSDCSWWCITDIDNDLAWSRYAYNDKSNLLKINFVKRVGASVRCVKD